MENTTAKTIEETIRQELRTGSKKILANRVKELCEEYKAEKATVLDLIKAEKATIKAEKIESAKEKFNAEHCVFRFNKQEFTCNPMFVEEKNAIIWTNLDKNAIYYAIKKNGSLTIGSIPSISEKSKKYDLAKSLVNGNAKKVEKLLTQAVNGLSFEDFYGVCEGFKSFKTTACKGVKNNLPMGEARK